MNLVERINLIDIVQLIGQTFDIVDHSTITKSTIEHDSLIIWPNSNSYFWYSKYKGGRPYHWLKYVLNISDEEMEDFANELAVFVPVEDKSTFAVRYPVGSVGYNAYIASRNITKETARLYKLEVLGQDVIIPTYNVFGYRCGSLLRRQDTDIQHLKYRKYQSDTTCNLWPYSELKYRFDRPVVVFEGAWSVMRWHQVSNGTILPLALIGTNANSITIELLNGVENVTFMLDNDAKTNAGETVMTNLKENRLLDSQLNWKFIMPHRYPDEMSDKEIQYYLRKFM